MLIFSISGLFFIGIVGYLLLEKINRRKQHAHYYTNSIYWIILLFTTLSGLTIYSCSNVTNLDLFFETVFSVQVLILLGIVVALFVFCELVSPNHFIGKRAAAVKSDLPEIQQEQNRCYAEKEYEGFLKIICNFIIIFLLLCSFFYLTLDLAGKMQGIGLDFVQQLKNGVISIAGLLQIILLPISVRQVMYYLSQIKRQKAGIDRFAEDNKTRTIRRYFKSSNKQL